MMEGIELKIIQMQLGDLSLANTDRYLSHIAPKQGIEKMREDAGTNLETVSGWHCAATAIQLKTLLYS
jgi:hypothetical protein